MRLSLVVSVEETAFDAVAIRGGWEAGVARLAALGFDGAELAIRDAAVVDAGRIEAVVRNANLAVPAIGTGQAFLRDGLSLSSADAGVRLAAATRLLGHVRLAARLDSLVIIGLIRGRAEGGQAATASRFLEGIGPVLDAAASAGVRLVIEPINRYETDFLVTVEETLEVIGASGAPHLGVLADTFHMNIEEVTIGGALAAAGPRLWHVHVADSNRWAPGLGHLDFPSIVNALRQCGYEGFLSAEILPRPDPETAARQVESFMRPIVAGGA
ncbi:MAG: sugar phosphate isomerase/epimerase [Armatimonadetes bacterium]|nr:sugar phosphate isomerase/epimerase [Armatimonadota bacterium]